MFHRVVLPGQGIESLSALLPLLGSGWFKRLCSCQSIYPRYLTAHRRQIRARDMTAHLEEEVIIMMLPPRVVYIKSFPCICVGSVCIE